LGAKQRVAMSKDLDHVIEHSRYVPSGFLEGDKLSSSFVSLTGNVFYKQVQCSPLYIHERVIRDAIYQFDEWINMKVHDRRIDD
jgi:hypothetical protein